MLKCLLFLVFVAVSQGFVVRVAREAKDIPTPRLTRITLVDDPSLAFTVDWTRVSSPEGSDRIEGYKVKVWETPRQKKYRYETRNGISKLVEEYAPAKLSDPLNVATHQLKDIVVTGEENTNARVNNIVPGVTYEVRVLAFTKREDGPLSDPMRIQVSPKDEGSQREAYSVDE